MATLNTENTTVLGTLTTKGLIHGARRSVYGTRRTSSALKVYHSSISFQRTWTGTETPAVGSPDAFSKTCQICTEFPAATSKRWASNYIIYLNNVFNSYVLNYDLDIESAKLAIPASGYYKIDYNTSKTYLECRVNCMMLSYGITGTDSTGNTTYGLLVQFHGYCYKITGEPNSTTAVRTVLNDANIDTPHPLAGFFNACSNDTLLGEEMLSPTGYFAV